MYDVSLLLNPNVLKMQEFRPIKLNKCSIMANEKMRSHKAKIYISSCSTMKIFNEVNEYFNSQD